MLPSSVQQILIATNHILDKPGTYYWDKQLNPQMLIYPASFLSFPILLGEREI